MSAPMLAGQRLRELRKRQTAFNYQLNEVVHRLSAPGDSNTDQTPDRWTDLWASWQTAEVALQAIADGLAPPVLKPRRTPTSKL